MSQASILTPAVAIAAAVAFGLPALATAEGFPPPAAGQLAYAESEGLGDGLPEYVAGDDPAADAWQMAPPACGGCGDCDRCRRGWFNLILADTWPRWTAQVDALLLWRGNIPSRPLFGTIDGPVALDANDLQTPATGGPRFGLFLHLDDCYAIEGNYFLVDGFSGAKTLPTITAGYFFEDIAGIVPPGRLVPSDTATASSGGGIQSAEMNWRRRADLVTWLAGFRWVQWNESLSIASRDGTNLDTIAVDVGNDLYGGQAGCELRMWELGQWLRVNALGKAGIFYNPAYQTTNVNSPDNIEFVGGTQADQTAFFGEFGVNATLQIREWLGWRVGYSLFWLSGVATAAEQLAVVNAHAGTAGINTNGSVLLQGVTTGIEARW
jgi:hypothetical protein